MEFFLPLIPWIEILRNFRPNFSKIAVTVIYVNLGTLFSETGGQVLGPYSYSKTVAEKLGRGLKSLGGRGLRNSR